MGTFGFRAKLDEQSKNVDFMVIMSDVIYPDGDVNGYVDGMYVPYKRFAPPIFALPGNHDWHDSLFGIRLRARDPAAAQLARLYGRRAAREAAVDPPGRAHHSANFRKLTVADARLEIECHQVTGDEPPDGPASTVGDSIS